MARLGEMMMMMTWRKCWTASGREAVGGAANSVAAIFLSIHESWNVYNVWVLIDIWYIYESWNVYDIWVLLDFESWNDWGFPLDPRAWETKGSDVWVFSVNFFEPNQCTAHTAERPFGQIMRASIFSQSRFCTTLLAYFINIPTNINIVETWPV